MFWNVKGGVTGLEALRHLSYLILAADFLVALA
jgi:hypothetical protein